MRWFRSAEPSARGVPATGAGTTGRSVRPAGWPGDRGTTGHGCRLRDDGLWRRLGVRVVMPVLADVKEPQRHANKRDGGKVLVVHFGPPCRGSPRNGGA